MKTPRCLLVLSLGILGILPAREAVGQSQAALEPLAWLVGPPWVGAVGVGDEADARDVSVWTWAVDGHALRNVHAVGDGVYGGETLLWWDAEADAYAFVYVTTGGFTTRGHLTLTADGGLEGVEEVSGGTGGIADGVEAVRSVTRRGEDGRLVVAVSYRRDGTWGPASERQYVQAAAALPCGFDPACTTGPRRRPASERD